MRFPTRPAHHPSHHSPHHSPHHSAHQVPRHVSGSGARRPGAARATLLAVLSALMLGVLAAGPASAHDAFTGSDPKDGATVATTPSSITLDFEEPPTTIGLSVTVTGPAGDVQQGAPRIEGSTVVQALQPGAPAGSYRIAWRVTSDDGHPVSGQLAFTSSSAGTSGPTATPLTPATGTSAAAGSPSASSTPTSGPTTVASAPTSGTTGGSALPVVLIIVVLLVVAAAVITVLRRRRTP